MKGTYNCSAGARTVADLRDAASFEIGAWAFLPGADDARSHSTSSRLVPPGEGSHQVNRGVGGAKGTPQLWGWRLLQTFF